MVVGPASRRPIRALVEPRRAARRSNAALVCDAIWTRVFPSSTCVIGISPRSESPESWAAALRTHDDPIRTWTKSAANSELPTPSQHPENRAPSGCRVRICAGTTSRQSGPLRTNADRAPPRTWPRERRTSVANDGRASFAYGRPLVRSGRGGRRPLSKRDAVCSPGYEAGRRRTIGVVAALSSTHE